MCTHAYALHAQSFREDLLKVKARFEGEEAFRANVEVRYYKTKDDVGPAISKRGFVKKWGDSYYSYFDGKEYLVNKTYTLLVDRQHKVIMIKKTDASKSKSSAEFSLPDLDSDTEKNYNIGRTVSGEKITYKVTPKLNDKGGFTMELDQNGGRLVKIIYYGGNSYGKTEISYLYPTGETAFGKNEFSETKYIVKSQKSFIPAAGYEGYEINDQTRQ